MTPLALDARRGVREYGPERFFATLRIALRLLYEPAVVAHARAQTWTRDPFDRLIVGQAAAGDAQLVTRDAEIRAHYARAVW